MNDFRNNTESYFQCNGCSDDLMTRKGRRTNLQKIIILSIIPVIALLIIIGIQVYQDELTLSQTKGVKDGVLFSLETGNVVHFTQIERGTTALYVSSKGDVLVYENLRKTYLDTDYAIGNLSKWPAMESPPHFVSRENYFKRIKEYRDTLDPFNETVKQVIQFYTKDNALIINWVAESIKLLKSGSFWQQLIAT
ncbi:hypothetical protein KUTeg_001352 [Tegillarca granosa]|uniref:Nitrate/nitrite sensing protein domain-containing protein n=1 Tax=Tegillarca granosa TaxID=220873 RepID=A0ABQ9FU20_TEGGR|nr:hypothetical protein KUTeg_001352 [Tegillarca granosa]